MTSTTIRSKSDLPRDPDQLQNFSWELTLAFQRLTEKYNKLLRELYGRRSEKLGDQADLEALQMEMDGLFDQTLVVEQQLAQAKEETVEVTGHSRRRKHPGRNAIPEELITEEIHDIPESEKVCNCGRDKNVINKKEHVVVEKQPARYTATRHIRLVYGCSSCKDEISTPEPVHLPIAKGLAGPELLVFVILSKYLYHLPLYRIQRQIFHESGGIWFTRSTLSSWVRQVCGLLERIHRELLMDYRKSRIKHADESPLRVNCDGHFREAWMWVGLSGDERTAVFLYNRHRSSKAAIKLLEGSPRGGYLMTDDCSSYNKPVNQFKLIALRCMVHIRRKFVDARKSGRHEEFCTRVLIKIGQLYRIERLAKKLNMSIEQRGKLRKKYSTHIMAQIKAMLINPGFVILPASDIGNAILHFLKNWEPASRFLDSGELPIDNSADERIIRPFAIGRKNWMQTGSENGAKWMAILYSIITTCKLNGIDPHEYLADVLMRLPLRSTGVSISDLTPIEWYKARNGGAEPKGTPLYPSKN